MGVCIRLVGSQVDIKIDTDFTAPEGARGVSRTGAHSVLYAGARDVSEQTMTNLLHAIKVPFLIMFIVVTVWVAGWEREMSQRADGP